MGCWISVYSSFGNQSYFIMEGGSDYVPEEQAYNYHLAGRLQEAKNEHVLVSFRYDNLGLPVEERCKGG